MADQSTHENKATNRVRPWNAGFELPPNYERRIEYDAAPRAIGYNGTWMRGRMSFSHELSSELGAEVITDDERAAREAEQEDEEDKETVDEDDGEGSSITFGSEDTKESSLTFGSQDTDDVDMVEEDEEMDDDESDGNSSISLGSEDTEEETVNGNSPRHSFFLNCHLPTEGTQLRFPPSQPQLSPHKKDEQKLLSHFLSVVTGNPKTYAGNRSQRALAAISNFRHFMAEVTASGVQYHKDARRNLRVREWDGLILDSLQALREAGVRVGPWEGVNFDDWLRLEKRVAENDRFVARRQGDGKLI
jgi:hypothetical protein